MTKRVAVLSVAVLFLTLTVWRPPAFGAVDCGDPVLAPKHQVGEKWTWTWTDERGGEISEVVQAEGDLTQMKLANGDVAFHDKDLIVQFVKRPNGEIVRTQTLEPFVLGLRSVNPTVGHKTLDFPLQVGKEWEYGYFASAARGGRGNLTTYWHSFKMVACEEVSTSDGKFPAFKVEVTDIYGDRATTATNPATSGVYHLWYAPQVKNYVKRHYVPSNHWYGIAAARDWELVKFEVK